MKRFCPSCGSPLSEIRGVSFIEHHGLTEKEFREVTVTGIRYDCESCSLAFLFFPKRTYFWNQNGRMNGLIDGWKDFLKYYKEKVCFS